jgi:hypothetical protein
MVSFPNYTLNFTNAGTTYSTFLTGIRGNNIVGSYVNATGAQQGLLYDLQLGSWTNIDFPSATNTTPYGLSFGSYAGGMDIVGSYKLSGQMTDHGFLLDTSAPAGSQWTIVDYPSATNTIPHSTFGGLVVGNWDVLPSGNPDYQSYPIAGNAFIYDIATTTFTNNDKPGALSTTAYGIWNGMIAGGYADTPAAQGIQPVHGYIYDMSTQDWHTYDHPGAVITHFDGITGGNAPGEFTLIGDWLGASGPSGSPEHAFILHVQDWVAVDWTDFSILTSSVTSGNSIYGDTAIGVYLTDPSSGINGYVATIPCFASGTRITTPSGRVAVERLRPGMLVLTAAGRQVPIKWIGCRKVACRRHPNPASVQPVRVSASAFEDHVPARDLWLSPDHAVYADGVLIPVKYLIDGTAITQMACDEIIYWHVELPHHDVILAEGLPVETYLETGSRPAFINGGSVTALYPDFACRVWEAEGCAPLVVAGAELAAVRDRLAARRAGPAKRRRRWTEVGAISSPPVPAPSRRSA